MRQRDDASTSASPPLPARSAAAEPPGARVKRVHNLPEPATHRESNRV